MDQELLFILSIAGAIAAVGFFVSRLLVSRDDGKLRERLTNRSTTGAAPGSAVTKAPPRPIGSGAARSLVQRIGAAAARPFMPDSREKVSALRSRLSQAGLYTPGAIRMITSMKLVGLLVGLGLGYGLGAAMGNLMLGLSLGGLAGYLTPRFWLGAAIRSHQRALEYALPDALDLMCVCIEAGLAIDAAMQRVGIELAIAHPRLAKELDITHMETRVGLSRAEALKNLGTRTANASLQSFAAMLIQAERFGTSIAGALKIHGESIRQQRQFKAEEMAAKASVKMSFPLVLFIFPATFIILAGPTVIQLMRSSLFRG